MGVLVAASTPGGGVFSLSVSGVTWLPGGESDAGLVAAPAQPARTRANTATVTMAAPRARRILIVMIISALAWSNAD